MRRALQQYCRYPFAIIYQEYSCIAADACGSPASSSSSLNPRTALNLPRLNFTSSSLPPPHPRESLQLLQPAWLEAFSGRFDDNWWDRRLAHETSARGCCSTPTCHSNIVFQPSVFPRHHHHYRQRLPILSFSSHCLHSSAMARLARVRNLIPLPFPLLHAVAIYNNASWIRRKLSETIYKINNLLLLH